MRPWLCDIVIDGNRKNLRVVDSVVDPGIERYEQDPHQSDELDADTHQFADDKPKCTYRI